MLSDGNISTMVLESKDERHIALLKRCVLYREWAINRIVNIFYVLWCLLGWYWNSQYGPRYDESDYVRGASLIASGNWEAYAIGVTGTLNRPYGYPVFVAGSSILHEYLNDVFSYTGGVELRTVITLMQTFLFWRACEFLATSLNATSHALGNGARLGLLGQPFLAFMMSDILSDALSLIGWIVMAGLIIKQAGQHRREDVGAIALIGFISAWLVMVRSANLPSMIVCVALYQYQIAIGSVFRRAVALTKREIVARATQSLCLWLGVVVACGIQALVMISHVKLAGSSSQYWGAGSAATSFGLKMSKYTTAINTCGERIPAAIAYDNPLGVSGLEEYWANSGFSGLMVYYSQNIWYMAIHLFNGINYDFPTTYVMHWNAVINFGFNTLSALIVAVAITGACVLRGSWERPLGLWKSPEMQGIRMMTVLIGVNYAQLAIISVENRYGVVGWAWVSVAAAASLKMWSKNNSKVINMLGASCVIIVSAGVLIMSQIMIRFAQDIMYAYTLSCK